MKILFACSECSPFAASGGLADVAGSLPAALQKEGAECRVITQEPAKPLLMNFALKAEALGRNS